MKNAYRIILTSFMFLITTFVFAQEIQDLTYQPTSAEVAAIELEINQLGKTGRQVDLQIPVAFHVIYYDEIVNADQMFYVPEEYIYEQISALNSAFSSTNFQFFLYSLDYTNNETYNYPLPGSQAELDMKNSLNIWPEKVINVYICPMVGGMQNFAHSTYPWGYPENDYRHGIIIPVSSLPDFTDDLNNLNDSFPFGEGKISVTQVGHYFGLLNTYINGCGDGDYVDDTPAQANLIYGCDQVNDSCPNDPGNDPLHNYMSGNFDNCIYEFTPGQIDRMDICMDTYKPLYYLPTLEVKQYRASGDVYIGSMIGRWENNAFVQYTVPVPPLTPTVGSIETLRGQQTLTTDQQEKYKYWEHNGNIEANLKNHHTFSINTYFTSLKSHFDYTYNGITIKNKYL